MSDEATTTVTVSATVTGVSPLMVLADGAETSCPAASMDDVAYSVDDRVQVQDRSPRRPLVVGRLETS